MTQPEKPQPISLDAIPRVALISMLKDTVWFSAGREEYGESQGYSLDVNEQTAIRDVFYRDEKLFPTPEAAILAHWQRHYPTNAEPETAQADHLSRVLAKVKEWCEISTVSVKGECTCSICVGQKMAYRAVMNIIAEGMQ